MRSRPVTAAIIAAIVIVVGGVVAANVSHWGPFADSSAADATASRPASTTAPQPTTEPATTGPATPAPTYDPDPTTVPSDPPLDTPTPGPSEAPPTGNATVVLTYAAWDDQAASVEVSAYVTVVEAAGTCTLTLTKADSPDQIQTVDALTDARTMSCGGFQIPRTQLSAGTWTAVVSYSSPLSSGQSEPTEVVVP